MNARRQIIRRVLEIWALLGAAAACVGSGLSAAMVAAATPVVLDPTQFAVIPAATMDMLVALPSLPTYGWIAALLVIGAAAATFWLSRDEDIRLQVTLFVSACGYTAAMGFWMVVGIPLVLLPQLANAIR